MFWGAICSETQLQRPALSWIPESIEEKQQHEEKLQEINKYWQQKAKAELERAKTFGTLEYNYMQTLNSDIESGKCKWKRQRRASQEFGDIELWNRGRKSQGKEVSKGGIDWFLYREMVLIPLLFPYIQKMKALYPNRRVWFVDDNVSLHLKAHRSLQDLMKREGIYRVSFWPPNSPDLHPIENAFDYLKDQVDSYTPINGNKIEKTRARKWLEEEWVERMDGKVSQLCASFKDKLERCIAVDGGNNFRG